ncbi:MAG: hypothetical protein KF757_00985 [Phycisphaeraceae bacterium]|nr:hypothetical protein [Phycisphaeraceae bacterium]MCW5761782.1 hypothetical protein [Phycisphaeraceae bacterium]
MPDHPTGNPAVVRYAAGWGYAASQWHDALEGAADVVCLKSPEPGGGGVWRATVTLDGRARDIVIKARPLDSLYRLVQSLVGLSQHARQWRGAERLVSEGFLAAGCVAILRASAGLVRHELLVLEAVPGATVFDLLACGDLDFARERNLALTVGRMLPAIQECGLINRDSKPSNLMAEWREGRWRITVLDTVAIGRAAASEAGLVRMLRDLSLEPIAFGCFPRSSVAMRVIKAATGGGRVARARRHRLWRACCAQILANPSSLVQEALRARRT